jgi:hypothetical protein
MGGGGLGYLPPGADPPVNVPGPAAATPRPATLPGAAGVTVGGAAPAHTQTAKKLETEAKDNRPGAAEDSVSGAFKRKEVFPNALQYGMTPGSSPLANPDAAPAAGLTPEASHMRYTDRQGKWHDWAPGQESSGLSMAARAKPEELSGLRAHAQPMSRDFPDTQAYTKTAAEEAGMGPSRMVRNPLLALSSGQLQRDAGVLGEREARYGGLREAALGRQGQDLRGLQLEEQMKDPLGYGRLDRIAQIERDKAYAVNRDKASIQSAAERERASSYLRDAGAIDEEEATKIAALEAHPAYATLPLIEQQRRKDVIKATANDRRQSMERARSYSEKFNVKDQGPTL